MSRLKIASMCIALIVLAFALFARVSGADGAARYMLPLITGAVIVLCCVDIVSYRKDKKNGSTTGMTEFLRTVMLVLTAVILVVAAVCVFML